MTTEQKAKAYDEAIKRAKDFENGKVHFALKQGESIVHWIFPELAESEDEKIRDWLVNLLTDNAGKIVGEDKNAGYDPEFIGRYNHAIVWLRLLPLGRLKKPTDAIVYKACSSESSHKPDDWGLHLEKEKKEKEKYSPF